MDLHLANKVIVVTGGASGIGEAIVNQLLEEKAIPVVADRSKEALDKLGQSVRQESKLLTVQKDLSVSKNCKDLVDEAYGIYSRIDGIVNNAGLNDGVGLENGTPEGFKESVINNLQHYYNVVHYALPYLKETAGSIINISSKTAITGQGGTSGYAAAKGAQLALTREWAVELLKYKIRVNAILPSEVLTPMYENWVKKFDDPEEKLQEISKRIPLESRMTKPSEIADLAVFLLSDRASHTTGQLHFVDGGYVHLDRALSILT